jgi:hypothetical protein
MGGEGLSWVGASPFTTEKHVFVNLGDGTYNHSGSLAVRAAIASGANMTYKLLFNDAVAMTGGQAAESGFTVPQITRQLAAEGVARVVIVAAEPERYQTVTDLAPGVEVKPRRELMAVQRALRELKVKDVARRRFRVLEGSTTLRELSAMRLREFMAQEREVGGGEAPASSAGTGGAGLSPAKAAAGLLRRAASATGDLQPDWLLVCDGGRWRGIIDDRPLQDLPVQRWDDERIGDHLQPLAELPSIRDDAPLWQAVLQLEAASPPRLLVLSAAGLPCGTIERPELAEAVLAKLGVRLPAPLLEAARRQGAYPIGVPLAAVAEGMVARSPQADSGAKP